MNYADIKEYDIANGPGTRVSLFVSGCEHYCKNCFNQDAWDFNYGNPFTKEERWKIISLMKKPWIHGLSILGGEPMHPNNIKDVIYLLQDVRDSFGKSKTIWLYSGYTWEELKYGDNIIQRCALEMLDVLVDGKFEEEKKDLNLKFRGSSNQRIIDIPASVLLKEVILKEDYML